MRSRRLNAIGVWMLGAVFGASLVMLYLSQRVTDPALCDQCLEIEKLLKGSPIQKPLGEVLAETYLRQSGKLKRELVDGTVGSENLSLESGRSQPLARPQQARRLTEPREFTTDGQEKFKPHFWKNHTRRVCRQLAFNTSLSLLEPYMVSKVLVDDKNQILYCQIAKVASTNLGKIFAVIAGKTNSSNPDEIPSEDVHYRLNKLQRHLDNYTRQDMLHKIQSYYKFVFVRDPLERLLSAYRNKFLKPATSYFAYLNKKLISKYRTNTTQTGVVTFSEFVEYLVDAERKVPMNGHWQPFHELCYPCQMNYDFVGKLTSMGEDIAHILKVNGLSDAVHVPKDSSVHSFHRTDLYLKQFYIQVPRTLLKKLYAMYYPDYAIFNFELPDVIKEMLK